MSRPSAILTMVFQAQAALAALDLAQLRPVNTASGSPGYLGGPGDYDLAADFGNMLDATATGSNNLVEVLPSL
jgi:hypothetical protein